MAIAIIALVWVLATPLVRASSVAFTLSWSENDATVQGYLIERSTDASNYAQIAQVPSGQSSYQDAKLALGATYYYRLRAYNSAGDSGYSSVAIGNSPPALSVTTPADYQTFTTASLTVSGVASDANGIQSVTVNGQPVFLNGNNWSANLTLASGTSTITVIATDNSANHYATTQTVHAVFGSTGSSPGVTLPGTTMSAVPTANFSTSGTSGTAPFVVHFADVASGVVTSIFWNFGDGITSTESSPTHTYILSGSFAVTMTVAGPGGSSVLSRGSLVTIAPSPDTTAPTLAVSSPSNYQVYTSPTINVSGTTVDKSGVPTIAVNGHAAPVSGTSWTVPITLSLGTNTIVVTSTDVSPNHNVTTVVVYAVLAAPTKTLTSLARSQSEPPQASPMVVNSMAQVENASVVMAGKPVLFTVATSAGTGTPYKYQWNFGDLRTATGPTPRHSYASRDGRDYAVNVVVSDDGGASTGTVNVRVAAPLNITALQLNCNFELVNADSLNLTASLPLPDGFTPAGQVVTMVIGGVQLAFQMDQFGAGKGMFGSCQLVQNSFSGLWVLTANLSGGDWNPNWAAYGLANETIAAPGSPVKVPVVVIVGSQTFAAEEKLHFTAALNQSGNAF